ncbi:hypothetical protein A9Q76_05640 [Arcobacter sp. 31_11_sub10_T18]|nr:hypothetical protein A9Q76_05640 [Arcobacter sp. 31_11_sub10_T18]
MGNADVVTDKKMFFGGSRINYKINFNKASIKEIMGLEDVDKETANDIYNFARDTTITDNYDLLELESIDINMLNNWNLLIDDMRVNINYINEDDLKKVKGVGKILAKKIIQKKEELGTFTSINQLKQIENLKKETFENIKLRFNI